MGNFSRDPDTRAADAAVKQYVAVRLQQGVPILDADWNLLDDLRRRDSETLGGQFIGDGVPTGSDGFRIFAVDPPDPSLGKQDFGIRSGLIIVQGKLLQIDKDIHGEDFRYTTQPNFDIPVVDLDPLELPEQEGEFEFVIFLDTWEREVDSQGEKTLVDPRIGIETAVLLKREWAVRVILRKDFSSPPSGHFFYGLAKLNWIGGSTDIVDDMLAELRDSDASPRREIAYRRGKSPDVLVNTKMFLDMLVAVRDNVGDFLEFLTTKFVNPAEPYSAGEVMGFETLHAIASLAGHGIALVNAKAVDTRGALRFFAQLLEAEKRFLKVWKAVVLPLITPKGQIYNAAFKSMVDTIETFLLGEAPEEFLPIAGALKSGNLFEAKVSQDEINAQFASEIKKPTGFLLLTYLGSTATKITRNQPFDLRYRVSGSVTPADTVQVDRFIDAEWKSELRNFDSTPFNLELGPGASTKDFLVIVTPSNAAPIQTPLSLRVSATHNRDGLNQTSGQIVLIVDKQPPLSSDAFALTITATTMSQADGVFQVVADPRFDGARVGRMTFRLLNKTNAATQFALEFTSEAIVDWETVPPSGVNLANQDLPAQSHKDYTFQFQGPDFPGQRLVFRMIAKANQAKLAEIQVTMRTA